nr:PREDICTED: olfactomedin-like protein 2B [Struthio camelus australis]
MVRVHAEPCCLLGDYDKVKAVSEGSDCRCKCLVRPLGRGACQRINEGSFKAEDFYTVETITSGPSCKCACVAPPSALNPCEGDFRLKKLREAESSDLKLSSIIEMLESAFYGLDLLKLHSVTTKLVGRVEKLEESVSRNFTEQSHGEGADVEKHLQEPHHRDKENCSSLITNSLADIESSLQRDAEAAYVHTEGKYEERFLKDETISQQINSVESLPELHLVPEDEKSKQLLQRKLHIRSRPPSRPTIVRGVTYYKAQFTDSENDIEEHRELGLAPAPGPAPATGSSLGAPAEASTSPMPASPTIPATPKQALDEEDIRNIIGRCKDTLSTISGPTTQNTYGRNEGAWMKDPLAKEERIYVTNYYYGNTLVEFRNLDNFKQGRWSNSYKLPYSWIGTGHVVYNGSFYYNRAFTRNIIKYDLKQRYVAAWAMLHDVAYEESTPWRWRGHSDVDFAVDENGLWVIYPAISYEGFNQEVIVLSKLNAADLSTQKETTWRTGLRKNFYGNCFVICGVLYAVDSYNKRNANISYAFDTHTNTQIIPRLLFENEYAYTTQIDYNPKDRLLYAWDNGHQVTYHVIFAY